MDVRICSCISKPKGVCQQKKFGKQWFSRIYFEEASDCTPVIYSNQGPRHISNIWKGRICTALSGSNLMAATKHLSNSETSAFQGGEVPYRGILDFETLFVVWYTTTPRHRPDNPRMKLYRFGFLQFAVSMADRMANT